MISVRLAVPGPKKRRTVVKDGLTECPLNQSEIERAIRVREFLLAKLIEVLVLPPLSYVRDFEVVENGQHLATTLIHVTGAAILTLFRSVSQPSLTSQGEIKWMRN